MLIHKVGLMITGNDYNFLVYSIPPLLKVVDDIVILDASTDETREYLSNFKNIHIFKEEDYALTSYRDFRQFTLDRGRDLGGTHFVVIDADEILSNELIKYLNNNDWPNAIYCSWLHIYNDLWHSCNDYAYEIQGIAFIDTNINYHGREITHEDKIPMGRNDEYEVISPYLLHFGRCNPYYFKIKKLWWMCLELLEGKSVYEINMRYGHISNQYKTIKNEFTYPNNIDTYILNVPIDINRKFKSIKDIISNNLIKCYELDIWESEIIDLCNDIPGFDPKLINCKSRYMCIFYHGINLIKSGELIRILKYFLWKLSGKCF